MAALAGKGISLHSQVSLPRVMPESYLFEIWMWLELVSTRRKRYMQSLPRGLGKRDCCIMGAVIDAVSSLYTGMLKVT
jgi:hypothetical protein